MQEHHVIIEKRKDYIARKREEEKFADQFNPFKIGVKVLPFVVLIIGIMMVFAQNSEQKSLGLILIIFGFLFASFLIKWKNFSWWVWSIFFMLLGAYSLFIKRDIPFGISLVLCSITSSPLTFKAIKLSKKYRIIIIIILFAVAGLFNNPFLRGL